MAESLKKMIELGIGVGDSHLFQQDKIWSRYSQDKVDIGEKLVKVIRALHKTLPLKKPLIAISIGSSNEPQFRILGAAFRGGLNLLDIEKEALNIVRERIRRQALTHVKIIVGDYKKLFLDPKHASGFLKSKLKGKKINLICLHHSMYYCNEPNWKPLFDNLYRVILAPSGAMHAVMMAAKSSDEYTTSWLYGYFAGKYFGCYNDQDLRHFSKELQDDSLFRRAGIHLERSRIRFFVNNFSEFMSVIWMIMLYPSVHKYTQKQKEEITEFVYKKFWLKERPLIQEQDHLVVYRGINLKERV